MDKEASIYVAGHSGMVGSALLRVLKKQGYAKLFTRSRTELDLCDKAAVDAFFSTEKPDYVLLAAARVGGIEDNRRHQADFGYENSQIQLNVMEAARQSAVKKLLFLASSCIYPRECKQPMREESLLTGPLEPTNEMYALAKLLGVKMCAAYREQYGCPFISCIPCNLYGPADRFNASSGHVVAGLITRMQRAKEKGDPTVEVWGDGCPRREFLHVDDLASACLFLMQHYDSPQPINVGAGTDVSIAELAGLIQRTVGYEGRIVYNTQQPNGMPRKLMDVSRLSNLGWTAQINLEEGLKQSYDWYLRTQTTGSAQELSPS